MPCCSVLPAPPACARTATLPFAAPSFCILPPYAGTFLGRLGDGNSSAAPRGSGSVQVLFLEAALKEESDLS